MLRPADPLDGATPSGASSIAEALLTAAHLVDGDRAERYCRVRRRAERALRAAGAAPRSAGHWLAVAEAAVRGPLQIAVACDPRARRCWPTPAGWRPAGRSWSAARWTRRRYWPAGTGWPVPTPPTCAAAGSATYRSPDNRTRGRAGCTRVVASRDMPNAADRPKRSRKPSTATSNWSPRAAPTIWSTCTPTMRPSRIRSVARCTSGARRFTASTQRSTHVQRECEIVTLRVLGNEAAFHSG